jgi:hypothetical protein
MNRRGFLTGLLASTAIARARARVSVSIGELLDAAPVPVPRWFAITPSSAALIAVDVRARKLWRRDGETWNNSADADPARGVGGLDLVEGHLGSLNGFTFKS